MANKARSFLHGTLMCGSLLACLSWNSARAEDTRASIDAGALVFENIDGVQLKVQDVYLSAEKARTNYRLWNSTEQDVTLKAAFVMPELTGERDLSIAVPNPASPNFMNLQVMAGIAGARLRPPPTVIEQKALVQKEEGEQKDITDLLKSLDIPLLPVADATYPAMRKLSQQDRDKLIAAHAIAVEGETITPLWTLRSNIKFEYNLPAGKEISISQGFTPGAGSTRGLYFDAANLTGESLAQYQKKYCITPGFIKAADLLTKRIASKAGAAARQVYFSYLTNPGGKAMPARKFHLVVDKIYPDNLVSFCADGAKKISGTRYEMTKTDYTPDKAIGVLLLDSNVKR